MACGRLSTTNVPCNAELGILSQLLLFHIGFGQLKHSLGYTQGLELGLYDHSERAAMLDNPLRNGVLLCDLVSRVEGGLMFERRASSGFRGGVCRKPGDRRAAHANVEAALFALRQHRAGIPPRHGPFPPWQPPVHTLVFEIGARRLVVEKEFAFCKRKATCSTRTVFKNSYRVQSSLCICECVDDGKGLTNGWAESALQTAYGLHGDFGRGPGYHVGLALAHHADSLTTRPAPGELPTYSRPMLRN